MPTSPCLKRTLPAWVVATLAVLGGAQGAPLDAAAARDADPFAVLEALRGKLLAASPLEARFVQTFYATGFEEGDEESGKLAIALPRCLRWDYGDPFPKSFLLCEQTAYYWNPGEHSGKRYPIEDEETPGLDFFLLMPEELRSRYEATMTHPEPGRSRIDLIPHQPTPDVVALHVLVDDEAERLRELSYEDEEGNRTRFELFDYTPGADTALFEPPEGMKWEEP